MRITTIGTTAGLPIARPLPLTTRQDVDLSTPVPAIEKTEKTETAQKSIDRDLGRYVDIKV